MYPITLEMHDLIQVVYLNLEERYISDEEDSKGHTPLWVGAAMGSCDAVRQLVDFGADVNRCGGASGTTPLGIAVQVGI